MAEYIERESFFKFLTGQMTRKQNGAFAKGFNKGIMVARAAVHNKEITPAVDVVEVVRCKDCKYSFPYRDYYYCENEDAPFTNSDWAVCTDGDDYCSYGERRTDNG